ncbi:MAG: hypothetical protein JWM24_2003 [Solirubrobacterales bacterium]|nr:hypothetical protein [Solirubrobacterales bacterium]
MSRLRHPVRSLKEPFGKAGLTVAIFALVLAMVGGAYAAGALSGKQKKEVEKIAKKFAGKSGTNGVNGTNGAPGAQGPAGVAGGVGKEGLQGKEGPQGKEGAKGKEGSPWTAGGTLPSGKTEMGTWATTFGKKVFFANNYGAGQIVASFTIPLAAPLAATGCNEQPQPATCQVHVITPTGKELIENELSEELEEVEQRTPAPCLGSAATPSAEPGNLCDYVREGAVLTLVKRLGTPSTTQAGVLVGLLSPEEGKGLAGTWAVTAE